MKVNMIYNNINKKLNIVNEEIEIDSNNLIDIEIPAGWTWCFYLKLDTSTNKIYRVHDSGMLSWDVDMQKDWDDNFGGKK